MRSNRFTALKLVDASTDQASIAISTDQVVTMSAQAVVTGTSTGTVKFQGSNDAPGVADSSGNIVVTNWTDIANETVSIAGAGTYLIPKFDICYEWVRLVFTHTNAASGTLTVNTKSLGF